MRHTKCKDCKYEAITCTEKCRKCGGELEILASEIKEETRRKINE